MSKTPVSILQEMMIKKLIMPNYELIYDGGGTHMNTFTYRVTCDGFDASGTGRSKKDAKHEAAKAMLKTIAEHRGYPQLPASPAESPIRTPLSPPVPEVERISPSEPFVNAIGVLQELCSKNNLNDPVYVQISDVGPPHAKIFTIQCKVTTFVETGISRTKKQAKHQAAKKMLDKLTDLIPNMEGECEQYGLKISDEKIDALNEIAKTRYPPLSKLCITKKVNFGIKISDYHINFKNSFDDDDVRNELIEKLQSLIPQDQSCISEELVEDLLTRFKDVLSIMNLDVSTMDIQSVNSTNIVAMKINASPDIVQIAVGETKVQAMFYTILRTINAIVLLLQ